MSKQSHDNSDDNSVEGLIKTIVADAPDRNATDIHIEAYEENFTVRYRIDGVFKEEINPPFMIKKALISALKKRAKMAPSERGLKQVR